MARSTRRCPVDVFRYHDYRLFLSDFYDKKKERGYSYRAFSKAAGLGAPNYLKLVILGDRNLGEETAKCFAATCGLGREATSYFLTLVRFNQSPNDEERAELYRKLSAHQRYRKVHKLEIADAAYHSTWYLPAIRELVLSPHFREEPEWIAKTLIPSIRPIEAEKALELLLQLGLLKRNAEGQLCQQDRVLSTGAETTSVHIRNYHAEMMQRARSAMSLVPAADRDISSLTMCLGPKGLRHLKERLKELRRELIDLCVTEAEPSQVLQLNLQLFPLSQNTTLPTDISPQSPPPAALPVPNSSTGRNHARKKTTP